MFIKYFTEYQKRILLNEYINNTYSFLENLIEDNDKKIINEFEVLELITN